MSTIFHMQLLLQELVKGKNFVYNVSVFVLLLAEMRQNQAGYCENRP